MISGVVTRATVVTKAGSQEFYQTRLGEALRLFGGNGGASHMLLDFVDSATGLNTDTLEIRLDRIATDVIVVFGSDGRPSRRFSAQQAGEAFSLFGTDDPGVHYVQFTLRGDGGTTERLFILRYGEYDRMQLIEEAPPLPRRRRQPARARRSRSWWSFW